MRKRGRARSRSRRFAHDLFQGRAGARPLPLVVSAPDAADVAVRLQAIDQAHGAVMPDEQAFRQAADSGVVVVGEFAN